MDEHAAETVGVIGGSGFYSCRTDPVEVGVETPFGLPSENPVVGELSGRRVAFVPRHGRDHHFPPPQVNYRANLWALRSAGARQVLAPCAVGSLRPRLGPGSVVVPDQVVDRTWGRRHTVYDHVGATATCRSRTRSARTGAARCSEPRASATPVEDGGTLVVINGPRFSTRAESQWHSSAAGPSWG